MAARTEVELCRSALDRLGARFEGQRFQVADAEEALAQHGYLHPTLVGRLPAATQAALSERHDARGS